MAIENDYLQREEDLTEFEIKRQRSGFEEAYEERVMASKRHEYDRQKKMLKEIYEMPVFSPQFHWNQKCLGKDSYKDTLKELKARYNTETALDDIKRLLIENNIKFKETK